MNDTENKAFFAFVLAFEPQRDKEKQIMLKHQLTIFFFSIIGMTSTALMRIKSGIRPFFYNRKRLKWGIISVIGIWYIFFSLPDLLFKNPLSVVLEDKNGELLGARIANDGQWRFPRRDTMISTKFEAAIIEFEDRRFYYHLGIDPVGIGRAIIQNIKNRSIVSGGSTISMQVLRLSRQGKPRSLFQKITEAILATRLELKYSKSEILSFYTDNAPFGGNVVGINAASWRYFGKQPERLSWSEAATLAVLPNAPALIHPGRNRDALYAKRNRLLDRLLAKGAIDSLTCDLAKVEPLPDEPLPLPRLAPHLLERAKREVFYKNKQAARIETTIDKSMQIFANRIVQKHHSFLSSNGIHNLSAVIMEIETGNVLAYVGNAYQQSTNEHGHEVDIVTASRSSGSILKPFLYALRVNEGEILPTNILPDIPTQMKNYRPQNFYETYEGTVAADKALARSLNVPAVRMLQDYGLEKFHFYLKKLGLTTINQSPDYYGLPLVLGGAEVRLWDLMGVYSSMGRTLNHFYEYDGMYDVNDFRPPNYLKNTTFEPAEREKLLKESPLLNAAAIWTTFEAMLKVERPTEDGAWELFESQRRIAWKTGTSFGFRDAWAIGVSKKYAVGVWAGNADGEGRPGLVGVLAAAPALFDIFNYLNDSEWFDTPYDEMQELLVCQESGYIATDLCIKKDTVLVPAVGSRSRVCPYHKQVHLDKSGQWQVHSDCESITDMQHIPWFVLPPVEEFYYKFNHPNYKILPPFRADCLEQLSDNQQMELIYPKDVSKIYIPIDLDGEMGEVIFQVAHRVPETPIYWHLDNEYLGATTTFHEMALQPEAGKHLLTLVDKAGNVLQRKFEVLSK